MKKSKIIYDIREKLKINSDDIDITNEYISYLVDVKRAVLIKQRYGMFSKNIPESISQTVCVTLEHHSFPGDCFSSTLVSTVEIPEFIEGYHKNSIIDIRLHDSRKVPINIVSSQRIPYLGYNRWTKNETYGVYDNKKLYIYSNKSNIRLLENIKITGPFAEPEEAYELSCENANSECSYLDREYNIEASMISDLVNMVVKELSMSLKLPEDKLNNSDESPR